MQQSWGRSSLFFDEWSGQNTASGTAIAHAVAAPPAVEPAGAGPDGIAGVRRGVRGLRVAVVGTVAMAAVATCLTVAAGNASADPSASTWYRLRVCESGDNYSTNTGNAHYGAYQFDLATWRSVGGSGYPYRAPKAEQDARALILYRERGWQPWQCASILGLREDSDARSGRISDIHIGTGFPTGSGSSSSSSSSSIPAFPGGSHQYFVGERYTAIKTFQNQMHLRGFFGTATGYYGSQTSALVKQLQRLNGLPARGYLGPKTWRLAWTGAYTAPAGLPSAIPAFPGGSHQYRLGDRSTAIRTFQEQMYRRGAFKPAGTGQYGPKTAAVVEQLQRLNGLAPYGYIGPKTWRLAWTGKYYG